MKREILILFLLISFSCAEQDATIYPVRDDLDFCWGLGNITNVHCETSFTIDGTSDHMIYLLPYRSFGQNLTLDQSEATYALSFPLLILLALGPIILLVVMSFFVVRGFKVVIENLFS